MFWNEKIECMSREELEELQLKKLQKTVKLAFNKIPYYNKKYTDCGVFPEDIETLKDIEKLPFITKDDLRESYPYGLFAVDMKDIKEIHSSSGTTGKPVVSGYTRKDLDTWAETTARGLGMMGVGENDIIQNTHGYGLFTGGFGVHYGSHKVGATIVPISTGQTRRQIEIMKDFGVTCLIATPSYGIHLAEVAEDDGINPKDMNLKAIGFGAEMWSEEIRQKLENLFGAPAYNIYGLTELMGPGVGVECSAQKGLHIAEDIYYPEIIDSTTGKTLGENQKGELADFSITPEQWGKFLCTLFDEWVKEDVGKYYIQIFDSTLANWVGEQPGICTMAKTCGHAGVMEFNGDVYSCDHFVFPEYKLGNIYSQTLVEMMHSERQHKFGNMKYQSLPTQCKECDFLFACNGECPKNRFSQTADGEPGLNYLCKGYYQFFQHVAPYMDYMKNELMNQRPPANIMEALKNGELEIED